MADLCGRLKCDGAPAGLQPGEAGVAIALAHGATANQSVDAWLGPVALAAENRPLISGASPAGEALTAVVAEAWAVDDERQAWLISDQNGECIAPWTGGMRRCVSVRAFRRSSRRCCGIRRSHSATLVRRAPSPASAWRSVLGGGTMRPCAPR